METSDSSDAEQFEAEDHFVEEGSVFTPYELHELLKKPLEAIKWLQEKNLIAKSRACPKCGEDMKLTENKDSIDNYAWRCHRSHLVPKKKLKKTCDTYMSIRKNSFFSKSKLNLREILLLTYYYVFNIGPSSWVAKIHYVSPKTVVKWNIFCRKIAYNVAIVKSEKIGGLGKIVEIGAWKCKGWKKVPGVWVFGGVERETNNFFMVPVEKRDSDTLIGLIKSWILPDSTIISDSWEAYDSLKDEDYQHLKVNHSLHFKDPETGANTNRIKGAWAGAKASLPKGGRKKEFIAGYLAMHMFRRKASKEKKNLFFSFLEAVASVYNPSNPENPDLDGENQTTE